jgi:hypothetical protein
VTRERKRKPEQNCESAATFKTTHGTVWRTKQATYCVPLVPGFQKVTYLYLAERERLNTAAAPRAQSCRLLAEHYCTQLQNKHYIFEAIKPALQLVEISHSWHLNQFFFFFFLGGGGTNAGSTPATLAPPV